ncbi:MAG: hypothetical protein GY929_20660 [Actinomycetia bacterium]|nr:hypothetical protein [Actinomycetes bacterium]MCP4225426.1 hypothetical protein [Actinomycetes bacterium]MCP5028693.1 hypothetical protein [Actinomycetes bacterium]
MIGVSTRIIVTIGLVVGGVGALDAFVSREWDLLIVFLLVVSLQAMLWLRLRANRIPVTLRPDLARWLERQSERSGEPFDDVLDRAVAWYHSGLYVDESSSR